ncbi:unnamed protein product [Rangifer tarandus platyrhynchus]|uniref:Uncharacterized protein n=1 Tax=Rangifer tarandus platyrhynchus TaxID=3082113 RepID=A0AC59YAY3_RANTA
MPAPLAAHCPPAPRAAAFPGPAWLPARSPCPLRGHPLPLELPPRPPRPLAPGPAPGGLEACAPGAHSGSLPGPAAALGQTPTAPATNSLVLAGHLCLQPKQAWLGAPRLGRPAPSGNSACPSVPCPASAAPPPQILFLHISHNLPSSAGAGYGEAPRSSGGCGQVPAPCGSSLECQARSCPPCHLT